MTDHMDPTEMSWLDAAYLYRVRISEEAFRFNTVSPPPPSHVWNHTTTLGNRVGPRLTFFAMLIPLRLAKRRVSEKGLS